VDLALLLGGDLVIEQHQDRHVDYLLDQFRGRAHDYLLSSGIPAGIILLALTGYGDIAGLNMTFGQPPGVIGN
jgi:hypothetical protein